MDPDEQLARLLQEEEDQAAAAAVRNVLFTFFLFSIFFFPTKNDVDKTKGAVPHFLMMMNPHPHHRDRP